MIRAFDELNNMRSLPFEQYFGEMELTDAQKQRRIRMAERLEDEFLLILALVDVQRELSRIDWTNIQQRFENAYMSVLESESGIDDYTLAYIRSMSYDLTQSTKDNLDDDYTLSHDRARYLAENEANTIVNHQEHAEAASEGKTKKTWCTMLDERVRHTHRVLEGKTIPIDDFFEVGDSLMRYPKDDMGSAVEIIGCRCSVKYS